MLLEKDRWRGTRKSNMKSVISPEDKAEKHRLGGTENTQKALVYDPDKVCPSNQVPSLFFLPFSLSPQT